MAKPRVFISSTYYDLKHIRNSLENFVTEMGYEPVLFESGDIPFKHDLTLDESCYLEIENSNMQVLIIGGRYGSPDSKEQVADVEKEKMYEFYNSVTKIEYRTAVDRGIPVFIFVEKQVLAEFDTFKKNRDNKTIEYAHVDNVSIFQLIEEIHAQRTGNYIQEFEKSDDITSWLRDQWAGLFADYLKNNRNRIEIKNLSTRINELGSITSALKEYTEAIMRKIQPEDYEELITTEDKKIELEKINGFMKESLMTYIKAESRLKDSPEEIYRKFKLANTVDDFVTSLKLNKSLKESILVANRNHAEKDFAEFKHRYQNVIVG